MPAKNSYWPVASFLSTKLVITNWRKFHLFALKRWVMSFGSDAELQGPEDLREDICNEAKKMAQAYSLLA